LNPHFLFNSFSTLIALIEDNSREAVKYVEELSNLFRVVLEYKDQDLITLDQECRLADNYIRLQKRRFGENLKVTIRNDKTFKQIKIPPLTLQLLIENAIKHNIVSRENPLMVEIYLDSKGKSIFVENNIQVKKEDPTSMGIGIKNIVNRYKLIPDRKVEVSDEGSVFRIALPVV
jgi:LytS/YehU family sensor histidine kinase